jgi:hypothetical protein
MIEERKERSPPELERLEKCRGPGRSELVALPEVSWSKHGFALLPLREQLRCR